jgi:hypothetical protein
VVSTGGSAGSGGSSAAPGCGAGIFEPNEDIIDSCVLRVSCDRFDPRASISFCVSENHQLAYTSQTCTIDAESCEDVFACLGRGIVPGDQCGGLSGYMCTPDGQAAVFCSSDGSLSAFTDCLTFGGTCAMVTRTDGVLVSACSVGPCSEPDGTIGCLGEASYSCQGGNAIGRLCSNFGSTCSPTAINAEFGEDCYHPGEACTTFGATCVGDQIEFCDGESLHYLDCGSVGLTCQPSADFGGLCVAPGCTQTDVTSCSESCDESVLTFCYGGAPYVVDCTDYGFNTCALVENSPNLGTFAYCAY